MHHLSGNWAYADLTVYKLLLKIIGFELEYVPEKERIFLRRLSQLLISADTFESAFICYRI